MPQSFKKMRKEFCELHRYSYCKYTHKLNQNLSFGQHLHILPSVFIECFTYDSHTETRYILLVQKHHKTAFYPDLTPGYNYIFRKLSQQLSKDRLTKANQSTGSNEYCSSAPPLKCKRNLPCVSCKHQVHICSHSQTPTQYNTNTASGPKTSG